MATAAPVPSLHLADVEAAQLEATTAVHPQPRRLRSGHSRPHLRSDNSDSSADAGSFHSHASRAGRRAGHRHRFLYYSSSLCICLPVTFIILLTVFAGSLSGAVITWRHYERLRLKDAWLHRSCVIHSSTISRNNAAAEAAKTTHERTHVWRTEAVVSGFGLKNASETVTAFWGRSGAYTLTESEAKKQKLSLQPPGQWAQCWVRRASLRNVSMSEVARIRSSAEEVHLNLAWGTSFFAAISGFLLLTLFISLLQRALLRATGADARREQEERDRTVAKRLTVLSPAQARFVVSEFGKVVGGNAGGGADIKDWTCSICLDDDDAVQRLRVVVLPCDHIYHSRCIRKWLRRGSPTCPLCNWDVQSLFNEEGLPVDKNGNVIESPAPTGRSQRSRQVLAARRGSAAREGSGSVRSGGAGRECEEISVPSVAARRVT